MSETESDEPNEPSGLTVSHKDQAPAATVKEVVSSPEDKGPASNEPSPVNGTHATALPDSAAAVSTPTLITTSKVAPAVLSPYCPKKFLLRYRCTELLSNASPSRCYATSMSSI